MAEQPMPRSDGPNFATVDGWSEEAESLPLIGPDPVPGTPQYVSTVDHYRVLSEGVTVLYREGATIAPEHRDLPAVEAVFDADNGTYSPKEQRQRKAATTKPRVG